MDAFWLIQWASMLWTNQSAQKSCETILRFYLSIFQSGNSTFTSPRTLRYFIFWSMSIFWSIFWTGIGIFCWLWINFGIIFWNFLIFIWNPWIILKYIIYSIFTYVNILHVCHHWWNSAVFLDSKGLVLVGLKFSLDSF